jgi:hypothetical protein
MSIVRIMLCAAMLGFLAVPSAFADKPFDRGDTPGLGWGKGGSHSVPAPAPIAGAGIAWLGVAGGAYLYRRFRRGRG